MTRSAANEKRLAALRAGRRRILLLVAGVLLAMLVIDWTTGGLTRQWIEGTASLEVATEPAGATVWIDGEQAGVTPVTLDVKPGTRVLRLDHPYHPTVVEELALERGTTTSRTFTLEPAAGSLSIVTNPRGAQVQLDGELLPDRTPLLLDPVPAGIHALILAMPGRATLRAETEVLPNRQAEFRTELEPALTGILRIVTQPRDAAVVLTDEFGIEHRPGDRLPVGAYRLNANRSGYRTTEQVVAVAVGERTMTVSLEALLATLTVSVSPSSATISVSWRDSGGRRTDTYHAGMTFPVGPVSVDVRAPGHRSERRDIKLREGTNSLSVRLRPITAKAGDRIQDRLASGGLAPQMIVVPAGSFRPPLAQDRLRALPATRFSTPFAIGAYEVTRADWARFASATDQSTPAGHEAVTDTHPIAGITLAQAQAYAAWLSRETGERYRLPTDSEWEYVARAGSTERYPGGSLAGICRYANVADVSLGKRFHGWAHLDCDDGEARSAPVGQYRPNAWGLYDTSGNVAEWTATCWDPVAQGSPSESADCEIHIVRGGSWDAAAEDLTLTVSEPGSRESDDRGLRLLREL